VVEALAARSAARDRRGQGRAHARTDNRYGYHRDELYYAVAAHHLALGYVDFPPVTPVTARLAQALFGTKSSAIQTPLTATGS
jgi:hypothetical protein